MNRNKENFIKKDSGSWRDTWTDRNNDMLFSDDDIALFEMTGSYTRALSDLEDVRNDPALAGARRDARKMVSEFKSRAEKLHANEKFITDVLSESDDSRNIMEEIKNIKLEINEKHINELTADWVKEWHASRQQGAVKEEKKKEIRNFITSSLEEEKTLYENKLKVVDEEPEINSNEKKLRSTGRIMLRYLSFSAAAAIALLIAVRSLLPAGPDKLYSDNYEPFNILSSVTRDAGEKKSILEDAVSLYKSGDYQGAAASFADVTAKDTSLVAPRFYFAMSVMAEGKYDKAIEVLNPIVRKGGEYWKEADWYLGLAYLKTGDNAEARNCFEALAQSQGYYSERAEKLLRRLK